MAEPRASLSPARRRSLTDEVLDQILELVATGDPPTVRLPPERVLCQELAVSRTALREALSALSHLGVTESRGKAKYGSPLRARTQILARGGTGPNEQPSDAFEVRRWLEPQVAARAAESATPDAIAEMERWVNALGEDIEDPDLVVDIDTAFHAAVAKATLNPVAVQLVTALNNEARGDRQTTYRNPGAIDVARTGHIQILAAIKAGDKAAARRAMERHLKEAKLFIHPKDPGP